MTTIKEVRVPDIGNYAGVEVIEVGVKSGDTVKAEDSLVTLETEKASMDVPCPFNGLIKEMKIKVGDKVSQGDLIALVEVQETAQPENTAQQASEPVKEVAVAAPVVPPPQPVQVQPPLPAVTKVVHDFSGVHAGPATRRLARELGVDLAQVKGSGIRNRIMIKDVQAYVKSVMQGATQGGGLGIEKAPDIDFTQFGEVEVKPLSRIKKWTAKNLYRNWITIPHITQFDEADITELEIFRQENKQAAEENGIKLTPLAFIIKACTSALKTYPQFNASLASNGSDLIFKKYFNVGVAVDTPNGLVVPVVKNVDTKGLFDIARELGELGKLARDGKLKAEQMQGNCFTISSLGGVGGTAFTPIINAPDVAILGVSKVQIKPVYINGQFEPRKMLPLSLSYDHRVIDGVEGAKFAAHIAAQLQDIRKLLL